MARPSKPRTIGTHDHFIPRLKAEREHRKMSYAVLAAKMDDEGCAIDQSAIGKIERGLRDVRIDELDALSRIFGIEPGEFIRPSKPSKAADLVRIYETFANADRESSERRQFIRSLEKEEGVLRKRTSEAFARLADAVRADPDGARKVLSKHLKQHADMDAELVSRYEERLFQRLLHPGTD